MNSSAPPIDVLVVDDSPVHRKLIEHVLSAETRYNMLYAQDGKESLQLYREHSPSIVITDWMMPDVSGVELCQQIRADNSRPYTYIILMTGGSRLVNATKGLRAGADDYLTKPFDEGEMLARIGVGRRIIELNRALEAKTRKLEEVAQTDLLTGLPNRRALELWADKELQGAIRHGFHFWVVLCDIDSFKTINDTFGHEAGDSVLRGFADPGRHAPVGHLWTARWRRISLACHTCERREHRTYHQSSTRQVRLVHIYLRRQSREMHRKFWSRWISRQKYL
jgi:two-component system, cell cycle response regulator